MKGIVSPVCMNSLLNPDLGLLEIPVNKPVYLLFPSSNLCWRITGDGSSSRHDPKNTKKSRESRPSAAAYAWDVGALNFTVWARFQVHGVFDLLFRGWPGRGNIRQLRNFLQRACQSQVEKKHLPFQQR